MSILFRKYESTLRRKKGGCFADKYVAEMVGLVYNKKIVDRNGFVIDRYKRLARGMAYE